MRGGGNDETVSTGCGPPSVLHILDVTVTYARDSFVDSPAGPFVLSRGGPDILAPGLQFLPLALFWATYRVPCSVISVVVRWVVLRG